MKAKIALIYSTIALLALSVMLLLTAAFTYNQKTTIADAFLNSSHNDLIIGNYRSVAVNLTNALHAGSFQNIKVTTPSAEKVIEIESPQTSFFDLPKNYKINVGLSDKSPLQNLTEFTFNLAELFSLIILLWGLMVTISVPVGILHIRAIESRHREEVYARQLESVGRLSRQIAHDLRSPLSVLQICAKNALWKDSEIADTFNAATKRLSLIADDLLNFRAHEFKESTNYKTEGLDSQPTPLRKKQRHDSFKIFEELNSLIHQKKMEYSGQEKTINFSTHFEPKEQFTVSFGLDDILRVISNLINNSFEAIENQGFISISTELNGDNLLIEIRDNGKGIPEKEIEDVFKEGFSRKKRGTGLGLAHAKATVQQYGGEITLHSTQNLGTVVKIQLPINSRA